MNMTPPPAPTAELKCQWLLLLAEPDSLTIYLEDKSVFVYKMDWAIAAKMASDLNAIYNQWN